MVQDNISESTKIEDAIISVALILLGGIFSGLTLGLLSIDELNIRILIESGQPTQQKYAKRIHNLIKNHHLLLVTLLLGNAACNEALPLYLDNLVSTVAAVVISITAVLFFGEVIPQAICSRFGLAIGAFFAPLVYVLMFLVLPVSWPIAKLLDYLLGKDRTAYFRRAELASLVSMHGLNTGLKENEEPLNADEISIVKGALSMRDKIASDIMLRLNSVFALQNNDKLSAPLMQKIITSGYSRIPVYDTKKFDIKNFILTKSLIHLNSYNCPYIRDVAQRPILRISKSLPLFEVFHLFRSGKAHIALVVDDHEQGIGIITMEDILEEIVGFDIVDETDIYINTKTKHKVNASQRKFKSTEIFYPKHNNNTIALSTIAETTTTTLTDPQAIIKSTPTLILNNNNNDVDDNDIFPLIDEDLAHFSSEA